ncbi:EscU/YscU/HrcU family type III secretion system export apparatus switch protein [Paenibacillus thiaminolyticus]|uniref:EscU/YscU/HrcU family type III secretion system export apparatus switch protein n=1 Tax=Paenibacillus thiaminolyticus TaxID=49283 RepID=UPI0011636209|nr:EscU/YscU/HrcU family type III secretion system export apparatus switch protein [Paenibacillus thiaminolyticus]NGP62549.1 FhlB domain-containing protein [Paenibacillus thiaminolyticus]WCR29092.1 EscU/YscU/HrcU family type III secretion system export apparatus switch protein [Paenibacillus thiaminolyticus]
MKDPEAASRTTGRYERKTAVALSYKPEQHEAPVIVAKGQGQLAEQILEKAKESGVPIQEDASLVEVLSKLDIDQQIPAELYHLVAEVLTFIYRTDQRAEKGGDRHE